MINRNYLNWPRSLPQLIALKISGAVIAVVGLVAIHVVFYRVILPGFMPKPLGKNEIQFSKAQCKQLTQIVGVKVC